MWITVETADGSSRRVHVIGSRFVIGRGDDCDLVLDDGRASRHHAELRGYPDGRAELHDLGSANGTAVNGHRLNGPVLLSGGERVEIGDTMMRTSIEDPGGRQTSSGGAPARRPSPSAIERFRLRRGLRATWIVGSVLVLAGAAAIALFATGRIGGEDPPDVVVSAPPAPPSQEEIVTRVAAQVRLATFYVGIRGGGDFVGHGTGWLLDASRGLVVTNEHVTGGGDGWFVRTPVGEQEATLVGSAPCDDIAVLRIADVTGLTPLPLGSQSELREGQTVLIAGFPGTLASDDPFLVTAGIVSTPRARLGFEGDPTNFPYPNVIQVDAALNAGNSGGPLVNLRGQVVGVNTISASGQNQNFSIGIDRVRELLPDLLASRSIGFTGMNVDATNDAGVDPEDGVGMTGVVPGSPAAAAGIDGTGRITAINGRSVFGLRGYCEAVGSVKAPTSARFDVTLSAGRTAQVDIPMASTPLGG